MEGTPVWSEYIDGRSKSFLKINKAKPVNSSDDAVAGNENTDVE
jgi:hypothetical protein